MLIGSEQLDAPTSGCGAIGTHPHSPVGRADLSLDRDHWSFDPSAYREEVLTRAYSPSVNSSVLLVLTCCCCFLMVAIALGAK